MCLIKLFLDFSTDYIWHNCKWLLFCLFFGIKLGHVWDLPTSYFIGTWTFFNFLLVNPLWCCEILWCSFGIASGWFWDKSTFLENNLITAIMVKVLWQPSKFNQPQILGSNYTQQNYYKKLAHFYGNHRLSQNLHVGSMQREFVEQWYHDKWLVLDIWGHFVGIINFHKIEWYMALHVGSMQSKFVEQTISWHVVCVSTFEEFC